MRQDIIDALTNALHDRDKAVAVVQASNFPPGQIPNFRSAAVFWHQVVGDVENGVLPMKDLLEAAYRSCPSPAILALMNGADERVAQIASALSSLFHDKNSAWTVVQRAGFPLTETPDFDTPTNFWQRVVTATCSGVASIERLLDQARRHYPYHPDLAALQGSVTRSPIRPVSPAPSHARAPSLTLATALARLSAKDAEAAMLVVSAIREAKVALAAGKIGRALEALGG